MSHFLPQIDSNKKCIVKYVKQIIMIIHAQINIMMVQKGLDMSVLSDKLKYFLSRKGYSMAELAVRSGIERSTLYQYIRGSRHLKSRSQLEILMAELQLTPDERLELLETYEIAQVGKVKYDRRCRVREILGSLLTIEGKTPAVPNLAPGRKVREAGQQLVQGELEVHRLVNHVIYEAVARDDEIRILAQPDNERLMESLLLLCNGNFRTKVTQIICLEVNGGRDGCRNLDMVLQILRYGIGIFHYEPRYYYGNPAEHYGVMTVLPFLIVTERFAVQISSDWKEAVITSDAEIVASLKRRFERMRRQSYTLMDCVDGAGGSQARWGMEYLDASDFSHTIELCAGLCSVPFWDEELIDRYLNKHIPGRDNLVRNYTAYVTALYQAKRRGDVTVLMNPSFVKAFMQDGVFREYPALFFESPVSVEDRKKIVARILEAAEEGWYHIRFLYPEEFPLNHHWEMGARRGGDLLFQYAFQNQFKIFCFKETDILEAVYDYLEHLSGGEYVFDETSSVQQLRQWMEEYLS